MAREFLDHHPRRPAQSTEANVPRPSPNSHRRSFPETEDFPRSGQIPVSSPRCRGRGREPKSRGSMAGPRLAWPSHDATGRSWGRAHETGRVRISARIRSALVIWPAVSSSMASRRRGSGSAGVGERLRISRAKSGMVFIYPPGRGKQASTPLEVPEDSPRVRAPPWLDETIFSAAAPRAAGRYRAGAATLPFALTPPGLTGSFPPCRKV